MTAFVKIPSPHHQKKIKKIKKKSLRGSELLQLVHLNTLDFNEQRVAVVQATENKRQSVPSYSLLTDNVCGLVRSNVIRQSYFSLSAHNGFLFWNFMISHPLLRHKLTIMWTYLQLCAFDASRISHTSQGLNVYCRRSVAGHSLVNALVGFIGRLSD